MSIPAKFMEIARGRLDRELFDSIHDRAVELERRDQMRPAGASVDKPAVANRVAAHLNGEDQPERPEPHVAARLERRMDIDIGPTDLGCLLRVVNEGGPNVKVVRQFLDLIKEAVVSWRGKHFVVVYSKSRNKLITAYPKSKKRPKQKVRSGRPKDWRAANDQEERMRDEVGQEGDVGHAPPRPRMSADQQAPRLAGEASGMLATNPIGGTKPC